MGSFVTSVYPLNRSTGPYKVTRTIPTVRSDTGYLGNLLPSSRTVYSYRTGKGVPEPEDVIDGPATEAGVYHYLHQLDEESGENDYNLWDKGHEFHSFCQDIESYNSISNQKDDPSGLIYSGPLVLKVQATGSTFPSVANPIDSSYFGTRAIALTAPTNPNSELGYILGSTLLGQELPSFRIAQLESKADYFRSLGDNYLNSEFGWKPFIQDVRSLAGLANSSSRAAKQFLRDSMRRVRRSFDFPITHTFSGGVINPSTLGWVTPGASFDVSALFTMWNPPTAATDTTENQVYVWFKGAYMYKIPTGSGTLNKLNEYQAKAQRLFGVELTPELLWQLAPWSWLVDWKINIGDILHNISIFNNDNLVMQYGYIMATSRSFRYITADSPQFGRISNGSPKRIGNCVSKTVSYRKERIRGTPYGFGVNPAGFTDLQWSILGALGITHGTKSL